MCLVAFLPMIFYSSVNILGCDYGPCASSAASVGFRSVGEYMFSQTAGWFLSIFLTFPLSYPVLLRIIRLTHKVADGPFQVVLAIFGCGVAYTYGFFCGGFIWASLFCLVMSLGKISPVGWDSSFCSGRLSKGFFMKTNEEVVNLYF